MDDSNKTIELDMNLKILERARLQTVRYKEQQQEAVAAVIGLLAYVPDDEFAAVFDALPGWLQRVVYEQADEGA